MEKKIILEKDLLDYVYDTLKSLLKDKNDVTDYLYHHNTAYCDASSIVKHGILSMGDIKARGIKDYSDEIMNIAFDIESHANSTDGISLSVPDLPDIYPDEDEFDPKNPGAVDFLISDKIKPCRYTINYGNEYISYSPITPDLFRGIDIRLMRYIEKAEYYKVTSDNLVSKYNDLIRLALELRKANLGIYLREMSKEDNMVLDIERLAQMPEILLKR